MMLPNSEIRQNGGTVLFSEKSGGTGAKVAHNPFNFGNYLWGRAMRKLGIDYTDAVAGAHLQNYFGNDVQKGNLDSVDDQFSIALGYFHGDKYRALF